MIETIYTELPIEDITSMYRPEFHKEEKEFKKALTQSMTKSGMKDPVYCWYQSKPYGDKIHTIVGNNRMAVAKELGIKEIPIIVNIYDPTFKLEGRELKTDDEIRALFKLGKDLQIRRDKKGHIDQIMPPWYNKVEHE